ncbi:conserved virulence factor C family protein [Evansella cellulosilytica]|uniref:Scaffold protein Nfu/NifU n=1 Tax=Evansella cellulosilytica (strain ATCC 21833 / DSM 2522 / FERM P-1141 / JCM 9156 / N-4) TaxID=649639 RepID=E6U073_EVAC2|nr:conserved virulence factor C family protein [Evansella cellulosilytica]ADU30189.1 Scaffold protein Nfu/NifU [Evansella cellulosilytica DSM 2522]
MKIISVEPTPSPNTMKLTLSQSLPQGKAHNYTKETSEGAPSFVQDLFKVEGVKGVYHVADFIAVERHPKVDWKVILPEVRAVFGETNPTRDTPETTVDEHFGEVNVQVHKFKGIPIQVKAFSGEEEVRVALPNIFKEATVKATLPEDNIVMQRKWVDYRPRYGDLQEVADEVAEEIKASYNQERLEELIKQALNNGEKPKGNKKWLKVTAEMLNNEDWKKRFAVLEQMDPSVEDLPVLEIALQDEKASIRRLATVYLGMIEDEKVLPYLYRALTDQSVTVRRTAGDALSDIGSAKAIPAMVKALKDKNKLVRWRAAMFLYEVGDETAIDALKEAENDTEFEVSMQVKLALARIEGGEEAKGSVWKQMTEAFD